jgi:hypothetical protein
LPVQKEKQKRKKKKKKCPEALIFKVFGHFGGEGGI